MSDPILPERYNALLLLRAWRTAHPTPFVSRRAWELSGGHVATCVLRWECDLGNEKHSLARSAGTPEAAAFLALRDFVETVYNNEIRTRKA